VTQEIRYPRVASPLSRLAERDGRGGLQGIRFPSSAYLILHPSQIPSPPLLLDLLFHTGLAPMMKQRKLGGQARRSHSLFIQQPFPNRNSLRPLHLQALQFSPSSKTSRTHHTIQVLDKPTFGFSYGILCDVVFRALVETVQLRPVLCRTSLEFRRWLALRAILRAVHGFAVS
jgi:hypothetical protein